MGSTEEIPGGGEAVSTDEAFALAQSFHQSGQLTRAAHVYESILRAQPLRVDALHFLAAGRVPEAADVYRRWVALQPEDPEARHMLAACSGEGVVASRPIQASTPPA